MFVWVNAHQQTDFVRSLAGFTHCLCVLWHRGSRSNCSPDKRHYYQTSWFYMCNIIYALGMRNKRNFLLSWLRGKVKDLDGGMLAEQDDVFESRHCFVWQFLILISYQWGTNLIFTNWDARKKNQYWTSIVLLAHVAFEWKQIEFIRTRYLRIYVVI